MRIIPDYHISNDLKKEIIDWFCQGHTCENTDSEFRLMKGMTHDIIVEWWMKDNEKAKRKEKDA
jgi:hypothetical protein